MPKNNKSVDLGALQEAFEQAQKNWQSAERALANAQALRDTNKTKYQSADQALRAATRSVLG